MKIEDLNDPTKSMVGGADMTIWMVMFGALLVIAVVLTFLNRDSLGK